jgi:hypothetical protein
MFGSYAVTGNAEQEAPQHAERSKSFQIRPEIFNFICCNEMITNFANKILN